MSLLLGPVPCKACRAPVHWNGFRWIGVEGHAHRCDGARLPIPRRGECGAYMPKAKDVCARAVGHAYSHRSRYALDNERRKAA